MATVEISDRKRRIVLDWILVGAIIACLSAFFDLRSTVHSQTTAFEQVSKRLDAIEQREQQAPANIATKADVARLETRIDDLVRMLMQDRRSYSRGSP